MFGNYCSNALKFLSSIALIEEEHKLTFGPLSYYLVVFSIYCDLIKCIFVQSYHA